MRFPDLEALIIDRLPTKMATALDWCSTDTPEAIEGKVGAQVVVVGGADDTLTDDALVDVQCFAPTRAAAMDLAEEVRAGMAALAATDTSLAGDQLVDAVRTASRPRWVDYRNPAVHRVVASYRVTTRTQ